MASGSMLALALALFNLLLLVAAAAPNKASLPRLHHPDDARRMSWAELDALFISGSIEGGIPVGYTYGFALVNPRSVQW
jgi:hypothetical protein